MKKEQKTRLALIKLFPDSWEYQEIGKLSDKLEHIKLSHNRKYKLLQKINNKLNNIKLFYAIDEKLSFDLEVLTKQIQQELGQNGRVNWGVYNVRH